MDKYEKRKALIEAEVPFLEGGGNSVGRQAGWWVNRGGKRFGIRKDINGESKVIAGKLAQVVERHFGPGTRFGYVVGADGVWVPLNVDLPDWVKVKEGEPCEELVDTARGDRWSSFAVCGRVKVNDKRCKMHQNAVDKRAENDRKWREKWDRQEADAKRRRATRQRAEEAIEVLEPTLRDLGVLKPNLSATGDGVVIPPELAEAIGLWLIEFDDMQERG